MISLTEYIKTIRPFIPEALVSSKSMNRIESAASHFPADCTNLFGFECQLGNKCANADFAFAINRSSANCLLKNAIFPEEYKWDNVRDFFKLWVENASMKQIVNLVCLEFDIEPSIHETPLPGVFISFNEFLKTKSSVEQKLKDYSYAISATTEHFKGKDSFDKISTTMKEMLQILPDKAGLFQYGLMLSRQTDSARLCFTGLDVSEIIFVLEKFNWHGNTIEIREILSSIPISSGFVDIAIDIENGINPKIGFEITFNDDYISKDTHQWKELLDYLTRNNLCTLEKAESLLSFSGYISDNAHVNLFIDSWPENLRKNPSKGNSLFIRKINHFKLIYEEGKPLHAKVYLAVHQNWIKKD